MLARHIKHFPEMEFTVVAVAHEYRIDFFVYDIEVWDDTSDKSVYPVPMWHKDGSNSYPDPVGRLEEAELYLHGEVKWDGCSNWYFDEQDKIMLHGCSKEDIQRFGDVMAMCWDWAAELCPKWDAPRLSINRSAD